MKRKFLFAMSVLVSVVFSVNVLAAGVFPGVFESGLSAQRNCSIASDIIPAFCAPSGSGSFSAAVKGCAPAGMSMTGIYFGMLALYGNLQNACKASAKRYGGTVQGCVGQWTCYWKGGASTDMSGLCNGNGKACATLP